MARRVLANPLFQGVPSSHEHAHRLAGRRKLLSDLARELLHRDVVGCGSGDLVFLRAIAGACAGRAVRLDAEILARVLLAGQGGRNHDANPRHTRFCLVS